MSKRQHSLLRILATSAFLVVLLSLIVWRWQQFGFEWDEVVRNLRDLEYGWAGLGLIAGVLTHPVRGLRWWFLIRPLRPEASLRSLTAVSFIGIAAVIVFGRPGDLVRPYLISRKETLPLATQLSAYFIERLFDLLSVTVVLGAGLAMAQEARVALSPDLVTSLSYAGFAMLAACLLGFGLSISLSACSNATLRRSLAFLPETHANKMWRLADSFRRGTESTKRKRDLGGLVFCSTLLWTLIILHILCMFRAIPVSASFTMRDALLFAGCASFGWALSVPVIGGGIQLISVVVLTELFGLSLEGSSVVAGLLWLVGLIVAVPAGVVFAAREGLSWSELKRSTRETEKGHDVR